jgi:quercetin dioxygenase-like cupin family protein
MKPLSFTIIAVLAVAPAVRAGEGHEKHGAAKPDATFLNPDEMKWGNAPPALPAGGQISVLHGDPGKKGAFTLRFKMPDGYRIPPHWHTLDEQLTIVSGTFLLHMGDSLDAPAHTLGPGAYHFLPGKAHHAAEAKGETIVQVNGQGPFDIHYLNAADDPRKAATASKKTAGAEK